MTEVRFHKPVIYVHILERGNPKVVQGEIELEIGEGEMGESSDANE